MNRSHALPVFVAFAVVAGAALADGKNTPASTAERARAQQSQADPYADNDVHALDLTPSQAKQAKADRATARDARAHMTPAQKREGRADKAKVNTAFDQNQNNDIHALDLSPADAAKSKLDAASARTTRANRTAKQKKAIATEKEKELEVVEKSGPG